MTDLLLLAAWVFPLAVIPMLLWRMPGLLPLSALPALLTPILLPPGVFLEAPWLLIGSQFGLDKTGQVFLAFGAFLWLIAGAQAEWTMRHQENFRQFSLFFLMAMSGNFLLILSQDMVNFYIGFSLMGLAAYGLVIHNRDQAALRAGRIYLIMTLLAEVALLAALMMIFMHAGDTAPAPHQIVGISDWAIGLLLAGLGIKAGLLFLHMWLPLAHPAAPVPASAVLSGAMIKVALVGWLRYLPLGETALSDWGLALIMLGMMTTLYAFIIGLLQTHPKVVLAYSSISKMGVMVMILGLAMMKPELAPYAIASIIFYAAYHGLTKGALFLGVGIIHDAAEKWVFTGLVVAALVMAGAPFTAAAMAKVLIKPMLTNLDGFWFTLISAFLIMATIGTTLMMLRFLKLVQPTAFRPSRLPSWSALPWLFLMAVTVLMPFLLDHEFPAVFDSWPVLAGIAITVVLLRLRPGFIDTLPGRISVGDIIKMFEWLYCHLKRIAAALIDMSRPLMIIDVEKVSTRLRLLCSTSTGNAEMILTRWQVSGMVFMAVCVVLYLTLWPMK